MKLLWPFVRRQLLEVQVGVSQAIHDQLYEMQQSNVQVVRLLDQAVTKLTTELQEARALTVAERTLANQEREQLLLTITVRDQQLREQFAALSAAQRETTYVQSELEAMNEYVTRL